MIAIALNALVIFLLYFPQLAEDHAALYRMLELIDLLFILVFVAEAIVKINVLKPKGYFSSNWNILISLLYW